MNFNDCNYPGFPGSSGQAAGGPAYTETSIETVKSAYINDVGTLIWNTEPRQLWRALTTF
jgi:hypothetical protein